MKLFGTTSIAVLALSLAGLARAQDLNSRSPFMPEGGAGGAAATENAPLELRGIVSTSHGEIFGLYDPSKKESVWVGLNDTHSPFVVRSHDVANETVTVDYDGRILTLPLKAPKIESMPVPNPTTSVANNLPRGPVMPTNPPAVSNPTAAEEARRLENVAAEVRRRRMLRAAAQQNGQPVPQMNTPPMPSNAPGQQRF